jgi:hypothetical protein
MKKETTKQDTEFVNPFERGITYEVFLKAKGNKSIEDYCNEHLTNDQIGFLKTEIELITNK